MIKKIILDGNSIRIKIILKKKEIYKHTNIGNLLIQRFAIYDRKRKKLDKKG